MMGVCGSADSLAGHGSLLRSVSSRADAVSGSDTLIEAIIPTNSTWTAQLNGRDVTYEFRRAEGTDRVLANLEGLRLGSNTLEIRIDGQVRSSLQLVSHPRSGPIFSGAQQVPFTCQTEANGLGAAEGTECDAQTIVRYYYKSTDPAKSVPIKGEGNISRTFSGGLDPGFKPYDPSARPPRDLAQTVTSDGRRVNYVVRWERGVINRGVYDIQFLHQPGELLPTPWSRSAQGWNGRLIYTFGGGCEAGYRQGTFYPETVGSEQELFLAQGYAIATSTLNILANNCNDRISAETLSMVKEYFVKQYGEPIHTVGWGFSGGAIEQYMIAQNYPGLLDGIIPYLSVPDATRSVEGGVDWALLARAFRLSPLRWSEWQKSAVSGLATWRVADRFYGGGVIRVLRANPRGCDPAVHKGNVYDPDSNPDGLRCDIYTNAINVLGRNPRTGFAYRPLDNVGVEYGLVAFNEGKIDAEHFIDLNRRIGGYDEQDHFTSGRMEADPEAVRAAYERGFVMTGGGGLGQIPIIDWRWYLDDMLDGHDLVQSFIARARLLAANGSADNQVILITPRVDSLYNMSSSVGAVAVQQARDLMREMDLWLDNISADHAPGSRFERVVRNKPEGVSDGCVAIDGQRIAEHAMYRGQGRCGRMYPAHGNPRIAAGAPVAGMLKCQLRPIRAADYTQRLTAEQLEQVRQIFPTGVCDYSRPGVSQQVTQTTWQWF
jgi:hypothetical protein